MPAWKKKHSLAAFSWLQSDILNPQQWKATQAAISSDRGICEPNGRTWWGMDHWDEQDNVPWKEKPSVFDTALLKTAIDGNQECHSNSEIGEMKYNF